MPTWLLIIIVLTVGCIASACITKLTCNYEWESSWQEISYTGSSVEPKEIYICKRCNKKVDVKYCYCPNCGSSMRNGMGRITYSSKIDLSEWED